MRFYITCFVLSLVFNTYSQQSVFFHSLCSQACKAIEDGNMEQASMFLLEAFNKGLKPRAADYLNLAKCYSQQNNRTLTKKYIDLALARDPAIGRTVRIHQLWFEPILGKEEWSAIVEKTKLENEIPPSIQKIVNQLKRIDSLNLATYMRYRPQLTLTLPEDSVLYKSVWDSVESKVLVNAVSVREILASLSVEELTHPAIEGVFLRMNLIFRPIFFKGQKDFYWSLIDKGFLTPDIMQTMFIEEYYGADVNFNFLTYSFKNSEFYEKYGVSYDYNMRNYRMYSQWYYDMKID
ncbi:MAG: hypothetical protein M9916_11815 [Crocinitomicaceae bacterium]|nr:hypothetical protein [Crocinitomicaceae bacterium]